MRKMGERYNPDAYQVPQANRNAEEREPLNNFNEARQRNNFQAFGGRGHRLG